MSKKDYIPLLEPLLDFEGLDFSLLSLQVNPVLSADKGKRNRIQMPLILFSKLDLYFMFSLLQKLYMPFGK